MNAILFVDDDVSVLGGLRDSLRRFRHLWEMKFVPDAEAAMQELSTRPYDVVVSDMRMPDVDGAALLADVRARYPATARIILSGHADPAAILRTLPVAHQYLTKPCDPEQLRQVVERICALNALIHNDAIRSLVGGIGSLPSVPTTYLAMTQLMAQPEVDLAKVIALVEQDPAMCVKVLQLVNSAYFGLPRRMTGLKQAVTYLGLELLKSLVLSTHVFGMADAKSAAACHLDRLREAAMLTATLARRFLHGTPQADDAFTAGMVHDIGCIVMAMKGIQEQPDCGVTHAAIGAYLIGMWGLPLDIVEAVAYHHAPGKVSHLQTATMDAVHVAAALADQHLDGLAEPAIDPEYLALRGGPVAHWRALAAEEISRRS
jgi:HD-like signal output (HDOD) protein/CheY-like chemotaxis protein